MRVFTYGIKKEKMDAIKHRFGTADYFDVTSRYQDILALCVDIVVIAVDHMFKHTLAIHNYMCEKGRDKVRKVSLLNVVFEPDKSIFDEQELLAYQIQKEKEHKGFERFKYALEEAGLIKTAGKFEVKYLSAKQFMDCFQMTNKKRKYLKRYTFEEL